MEIESIEKKTLDEMFCRLKVLENLISSQCNQHLRVKLNQWLDAQDVCMILNISSRTSQ